jgi:hypothetical protein
MQYRDNNKEDVYRKVSPAKLALHDMKVYLILWLDLPSIEHLQYQRFRRVQCTKTKSPVHGRDLVIRLSTCLGLATENVEEDPPSDLGTGRTCLSQASIVMKSDEKTADQDKVDVHVFTRFT